MIVIAVANGKGGVGKTSCAVEIAAGAAARGVRTVVVDLDSQGNVSDALGESGDDGRALAASLVTGTPPAVSATRRSNLGLVAGGQYAENARSSLELAQSRDGGEGLAVLADAIRGIDADLVVLDTPPTDPIVVDAALVAADWLLIPTRADTASVGGLEWVAQRFGRLRQQALSKVQLLGVVLFDIGSGSKRVRADVRAQLSEAFGDDDLILEPVIRHAERPAIDTREFGLTAAEYVTAVALPKGDSHPMSEQLRGRSLATPKAAAALAADYAALTSVVVEKLSF